MKYVVLRYFTDLQDNNYAYHTGDSFPRDGLNVSDERIKELSGNKNKRKIPLIEAAEVPTPSNEEQPIEAGDAAPKAEKPKRRSKK